jgi:exosortase
VVTTVTTARDTSRRAHDASARILGLFTPAGLVMTSAVFVGVIALFYRFFEQQHRYSTKFVADWGHAYFIPLISIYILWQHRDALAKARTRTFWPALVPIVLGIFSYWFFIAGIPNHMFQGAALVLTIFGLVLLLAGPEVMRIAFLPIAFLLFGVTISEKVMLNVTFPLQTVAAAGADILLQIIGAVFGFACERVGNRLTIIDGAGVGHALNVAEACSGMRMVIAFLALGGAVALLGLKQWWQRVALMLLTIPVAVLLNVIRVGVLGIASLFNDNFAEGEAHTLIGTLLLLPGLGLFILVVWVLNHIVDEPKGAKA